MPQGCPSKSRDKSIEFQQQIVPGRHDEIMLLEGSEGKCHGTPGVRSASVSSRRVKLSPLQHCRLCVWRWVSHWRVAHCRSASAWLPWKSVQVRCWKNFKDLSVFSPMTYRQHFLYSFVCKVFEELSHLCCIEDTLCCYFGAAITGEVQNLVCCLWRRKSLWTLQPQQSLFLLREWGKPTWVQVMHRETRPGTLNGPASALAPRQGSSAGLHFMQMGLPHSWWGNAWVSLLQNDSWTTVPGKSSPDGSSVSAGHTLCGPGLANWPWRRLPMLWNEFFNQETKFPFL